MKRLGASVGLSSLITMSLVYFLGEIFMVVTFAVLSVLVLLSFIIKKYRNKSIIRVCIASSLISILIFSCYTYWVYQPVMDNYSGKELSVTATVKEAPYKNYDNYYYYVKTSEINQREEDVEILLKADEDLKLDVDDIVKLKAQIVASNDIYKAKGYFLYGNINSDVDVISGEEHSFFYYPYKIRQYFESVVSDSMDEKSASICNAVAFGDKANVDYSIKEIFRKAGLQHLLVVSGLHLSILSYVILFLLKKLLKRKYYYCPVTMGFVVFYMVMTGLSPSIIRSGIMMLIMILADLLWRDADSLNSLGISAIILLIENPYSAGDIGLLMSFSATLGIILFSSPIYSFFTEKLKFRNRIIKWIVNSIAITLSANIFTVPLSIAFFKHISLVQVFSNLIIGPVFPVLLCTIFAGVIFSCTGFYVISTIALFLSELVADVVYFLSKAFSLAPMSYVSTDSAFVYVWLVITGISALFIVLKKKYKITVPIAVVTSAVAFIIGFISSYFYYYNNPQLVVYDTGNGISAVITSKGKSAVLSCGGDYGRNIVDNLEESFSEYELMSVTSSKNARSRYSEAFAKKFDFKAILIYDSTSCEEESIIRFNSDYTVKLKDMTITYLVRKEKVYTYAECEGKSILILPKWGDARSLEDRYRHPDIVILDSYIKNSNYFSADLLIVCCNEDNYSSIIKECYIRRNTVYTTYNGNFKSKLEVW